MLDAPIVPWTPPPEYMTGTHGHKTMYLADISVGSGGQSFKVLVDTGSDALVLPSEACTDKACTVHHRFGVSKSTSAQDTKHTLMIGFGMGQVKGKVYEDQVCLSAQGNTASLNEVFLQVSDEGSCAKMHMLVADTESDDLAKLPADGILGLGLDDPQVGGPEYSFIRQLVSAGKLSSSVFALHLSNSGDSALTLGGVDESALQGGQVSWWNLSPVNNGYWQFSASDITLDGTPQNFGELEIAVDSGTSLLAADGQMKNWMEQHLQLSGNDGCSNVNNMPKVGLRRHDGTELLLLPSDYVDESEGTCTLAIMPGFHSVNGQRLILGDSFLRRYVTVFDRDNARIGFGVAAGDEHSPQLMQGLFPPAPSTTPAPTTKGPDVKLDVKYEEWTPVTTTTISPEEIAHAQKQKELNAAFSKLPDDFTDSFHKELQNEQSKAATEQELKKADAVGDAQVQNEERAARKVEAREAVASVGLPAQPPRQDSTLDTMPTSQYIHTMGQLHHNEDSEMRNVESDVNSEVPSKDVPDSNTVSTPSMHIAGVTESAARESTSTFYAANVKPIPAESSSTAATTDSQESVNPYTGQVEASQVLQSQVKSSQGSENPYLHFLKLVQLGVTPQKQPGRRNRILKIPLRRITG
eukprot:gnl/MRDRNA2_/MRDRNA2_29136_c0_seq1.p1 gnl/MRDRNA2_/MRDRNA2_29136_c0~~gnl/MRDRNA2_/MRDRNA2_29136_c0_seq1.p1  ORF type:complete len:674 (+),score=163.88 gnl/MRDRNA2_/MRDRNA2_29136_c0_seq1:109-2022(+)